MIHTSKQLKDKVRNLSLGDKLQTILVRGLAKVAGAIKSCF